MQKITCRGGRGKKKNKPWFHPLVKHLISITDQSWIHATLILQRLKKKKKDVSMPIMEFSFSPTSSIKLMWLSSKMTKWNKTQNLASQLVVIRFFRILKTDFKSLLLLLKRILTTENHNDNIYFHLLGEKCF